MANKFQQSVLERLEQERQRTQQKKPEKTLEVTANKGTNRASEEKQGATEMQISASQPAGEMQIQEPELIDASAPNGPKLEVDLDSLPDISKFQYKEKQRAAKNKTFYLDEEVITTLHNTAKRQGITDSKLCNDILRSVLGLNG